MGIRTCCVKRENEEDRNLQKVLPNNNPKKIYERNDNTIKVENGGFFTVKTTEKIFDYNTNIYDNINFISEKHFENTNKLDEKKVKKIQNNIRILKNKNKFKNEIKPLLIEQKKSLLNKLYLECEKGGELPSSDDFDKNGWKKYYQPNERFFLYQKGKVFPNQIRIYNIDNKYNLQIYEGEMNIDNLKHGFGILTTPQYQLKGFWRKNEFTGWGRKSSRNGEIMEGKFIKGKLNGKGIFKNLTCIYEGEFLDSKRCGKGELKTNKYIYKGDFDNDQFNGNGFIEFLDEGSKYNGNFVKNEIYGKGIFEWKNGDIYEGDMKKGKMHGYGKFTFNDGTIYGGEYRNGIKQGKGKLIYPGNKIFDGYFDKGLPEGEGIYSENGKTFKVLFSQGNFIQYLDEQENSNFGGTL
jgi:hypothetical protein